MERGYFLRITPKDGTCTFQELSEALELIKINKYFVCEEEANRRHFHLCLYTTRSAESLRYQIKRYIEGEVYISGKDIENQVKAIAYCMKDGRWKQRNIDINTIMMARQTTFQKSKEKPFEKALNDIISNTEISTSGALDAIIELHCKHNRRIYPQHIEAIARLREAKQKADYRIRLRDRILENLYFT